MLREMFPNSLVGAEMYGGFMQRANLFCKIFEAENSFDLVLNKINDFLDNNGYDIAKSDDFDDSQTFQKFPVTISPDIHSTNYFLYIERDYVAKSQTDFLIHELVEFRDVRDWAQFHNSKDLAIALSIESNELLEQFLWKKPEDAKREKLEEELADVFAYALLLSDRLGLNVEDILLRKIQRNAEKYPVEKAKGTAKKYNEL
ncbi:MAG: nucleotide pyrophosphohydrolase [Bacteroidales bacterium]